MFNEGFQAAMGNLEALQMLSALRVMVAGDMIPRLPPRQLGGCHATRSVLYLTPGIGLSYDDDDPDDLGAWSTPAADDHICHALYLGAETTPGRTVTVPADAPWTVK